MNTDSSPTGSMAAWQEQNNRYLAASLQWLRLRLVLRQAQDERMWS